jgi:hypothetical protein
MGQIPRAARRHRRHRELSGTTKMIHRFDIFEMPKVLQVNLTSNGSLMQFTGETAIGFFMFRPEVFVARIGPRPILILHSSTDTVTNYEEASAWCGGPSRRWSCISSTASPISYSSTPISASRSRYATGSTAISRRDDRGSSKTNILPREAGEDVRKTMAMCPARIFI